MRDDRTMLCVGGPYGGRRIAVDRNTGFTVPVISPVVDQMKPEVVGHEYVEMTFRAPQGDISFWAPRNQTLHDTLRLLLQSYQEGK